MNVRRSLLVLVAFIAALAAFTQPTFAQQSAAHQPAALNGPSGNQIDLNVVVAGKSGSPVIGLEQQDFTILDNKVPQKITSFQALDGTQGSIEATIVIDAVNSEYHHIPYERDQIDRFLRADQGELRYPTSIVLLTDTGMETIADFSKDGNQLSAALDKYTVGFRFLTRAAGFYGAADRFQISLDGLHQLARRQAPLPGRKIMLWVSPGWPLLSGPEVFLDNKERQQLFADIVNLSTDLRRDRITVYSIDPAGMLDSLSRDTYWENFTNAVSKPGQAQIGNLGLQVVTVQSGGVVFSFNNDLTALLERCLADTRASYEIAFEPPAGTRANEYHHLEIRIAKHGLKARTWQGYYSEPALQWQPPTVPPPAHIGERIAE
jgi:VWFA-related protein